MWNRGTVLLLSLDRVAAGSTSPSTFFVGSIFGMSHAEKISITYRGSYGGSGGTCSVAKIYAATARATGSVDYGELGSIAIPAATNATRQRTKIFTQLADYPYLTVKVLHQTGSKNLGPQRVLANVQW